MPPRPLPLARLLGALLLVITMLPLVQVARAANPGEPLFNSPPSTLAAGQTSPNYPYYIEGASEAANLRLTVSGGSADETVTLTLKNSSGAAVGTWTVRNGETIWGSGTLPQGGFVALHNDSGVPLTYTLDIYAVDTAPSFAEGIATWEGVSKGGSLQSALTLNAPAAGLYRFTLGASEGAYQLVLDQNYLRKTVQAGSAPSADDSIYYLSAGAHSFTIVQNAVPGLLTRWSLQLAAAGSNDALPASESSAVLGGGAFFREEWVPLNVAVAQEVNISITTGGSSADSLGVELYNGGTRVFSSTTVLGGEVSWGSTTLAAGANALRVVARDGNAAALSYTVRVEAVASAAQTPFSWSGKAAGTTSRANEGHSSIKLSFPTSGLYSFTLGAAAGGRFQFLLGDDYLQKTISETNSLSAYVAAGTYTLLIAQDPQVALTDWQVSVQPAGAASDSLPYTRSGGGLGKADGKAFDEEWLPIQAEAGAAVNIKLVAHGTPGDALLLELYGADGTPQYTAANVFGGEIFWATTALASGTNRLRVLASGAQLSYEVTVQGVPTIPASGTTGWSGVSLPNGLNSAVRLNAPVAGVYDVVLNVSAGAARPVVGPGTTAARTVTTQGTLISLRVPLTAGLHSFTVEQDAFFPEAATWSMAVSLRRATAVLTITNVLPGEVSAGRETTVTVTGSGFENGTLTRLLPASGDPIALNTVVVSSTELVATIPASAPVGLYGLEASGPGGQSATRSAAITISAAPPTGQDAKTAYLPLVSK